MYHLKCPPLAPLIEVVRALEDGGLACALGGSGLLAALGLAEEVRDWDLTTDAPHERVRSALASFHPEWVGASGIHTDQKFMMGGGTVECIVGFAIRSQAGVARIPTIVTGRWRDIPVGSPEAWAVAYALLAEEEKTRAAKADKLFDWLEDRGADPVAVTRLLAEPLPGALAARLRALPSRSTSSST